MQKICTEHPKNMNKMLSLVMILSLLAVVTETVPIDDLIRVRRELPDGTESDENQKQENIFVIKGKLVLGQSKALKR
ncbi:hypothetical protein SNE40_022596 [Patella caerulea]|uniref:Uncharacterized protein n=1 Tax=Patella caerulea TaxID=87958 RepID=A0AAN8GB38_PATCE